MTFDECHKLIKNGDMVALRHALDGEEADPNLRNHFSWTLLMLAALEGNTRIAELLLERGAEVNEVNDFGESALSLAAQEGHIPFVRLVLKSGASSEVQPHGATLKAWLKVASGLKPAKIASIIEIITAAKCDREPM
jgi:ankyrin repeat protein